MADIADALKQQVEEDLARSGLTLEDVHGLKVVGLEAMKPLPGSQDDLPDEGGEGYDPDEYEDDEPAEDPSEKFEAAGGYVIPYLSLYGKPIRDQGRKFQRVRLVGRKNDDVPRYRSPRGASNHVYVPQGLRDLLVRITRQREIQPDVDILYITEGEKKAVRGVKAGMPMIALPGVTMWTDSAKVRAMKRDYENLGGDPSDIRMTEDTPINPELLEAIEQAQALCLSIGIVCILYDSGGKPILYKEAFRKTKNGLVAVGGVDWKGCDVPYDAREGYVSENPAVTHAGFTLAAALRKQITGRVVVATRFCDWNKDDSESWVEQGLDDWLQAEEYPHQVQKRIRGDLDTAMRLWKVVKTEPLFSCSADPDELGTKGGPSAEIAFSRMLDGNIVGRADGLLYQWVGSHWQMVETLRAEDAAHLLLDAFYAEGGTARRVTDAPKLAVSAPSLYKVPVSRRWSEVGGAIIPCADVTLDISQKGAITVREPDKADGLRYCIAANWADKDKPSPEFDQFIAEVLPDPDVRRLVQQYAGYTLIGDTRYQTAQWWFGSGANGKGFLAGIIASLHRKVAAADIEDLGGFGAESLIDASLVTVDETPKRVDEERIKSAISGDPLTINRKYQTPVTVRLKAKWLLRGNDKPSLSDQSDGLWRRLHIIEFRQKFEGNRRDDMLADRIVENELAGVMRWAVEGLVQLLKAGGFKNIPESVQASKREMQVETNNVLGWWEDKDIRVCNAPRSSKSVVYQNYSLWCRDNGMMPLGSPRFWVRVKSIVERESGMLSVKHAQETHSNPLTGATETVRTLKVNLDIDGGHDGEATDNVVAIKPNVEPARNGTVATRYAPMDTTFDELDDVIPMRRLTASTEAPTTAPDMAPVATGFVELDEPEPDAVVDVAVTDEQLLPALDVPPDKGAPPDMGKAPIIPSFPAQATSTIRPIKKTLAKSATGGEK